MDEPTSLPEGTEVELFGDEEELTDEEVAELRRRANDGQPGVPAEQVFAKMRRT